MIRLSEISALPPKGTDKDEIKKQTKNLCKEIAALQHILYAQRKYSLLVVLQGMDASGKDGTTRRVFGACSPAGIDVKAFKKPSEEEFAHDFLWRIHKHSPAKGMVQIFNRSHYEDVLIQRVHKWITEDHAQKRLQSINAFEELLEYDNNTKVLKFYLHISQEKQKEELLERLQEPHKHWKHNSNDWKEAELWDEYMRCYEDAINKGSIPWNIVPVDKGWYGDFIVASKVVETLRNLDLQLPTLNENI
jgi:PPK2 family polyphosphate:nucleotide phosphotransferase